MNARHVDRFMTSISASLNSSRVRPSTNSGLKIAPCAPLASVSSPSSKVTKRRSPSRLVARATSAVVLDVKWTWIGTGSPSSDVRMMRSSAACSTKYASERCNGAPVLLCSRRTSQSAACRCASCGEYAHETADSRLGLPLRSRSASQPENRPSYGFRRSATSWFPYPSTIPPATQWLSGTGLTMLNVLHPAAQGYFVWSVLAG